MIQKTYSETDQEFAFEWAARWFRLVELIMRRGQRVHDGTPAPAEDEDAQYQELHSWLGDNEPRFIPLWQDFYQSQDWALHTDGHGSEDTSEDNSFMQNPFSFLYTEDNLSDLIPESNPGEYKSLIVLAGLLGMDKRMVKFYYWVCYKASRT